jgi:hypothetical protein
MDTLSLTDPQVRIFEWNTKLSTWVPIGITETIKDNLNPDFKKLIKLPYHFEKT